MHVSAFVTREAIIGELQEHIQILEDEGARSAEYV